MWRRGAVRLASVVAVFAASMPIRRWSAGRLAPNHDFDAINTSRRHPINRVATTQPRGLRRLLRGSSYMSK